MSDTTNPGLQVSGTHAILIAIGSIVFVLFCLLIMCMHFSNEQSLQSHIEAIDQYTLLREDLADTQFESGSVEWQCIVCIHTNHPDTKACHLCGTPAELSLRPPTFLASNGSQGATITMTVQSSNTTKQDSRNSICSNSDQSDFSTEHRQRALRYRRLNQIQLNQRQRAGKSRRMWQRVPIGEGKFVWVRTNDGEIKPTSSSKRLLRRLKNNSFLLRQQDSTLQLQDTLMDHLRHHNGSTMAYFSELNAAGIMSWKKADGVHEIKDDMQTDLESLMSLRFRDKRKWFIRHVSQMAVPYTECLFRVNIRRTHVLQDSMRYLSGIIPRHRLREHLHIFFIGEPALDAGGVLREWFSIVCKELFQAEQGLFSTTHAENMSYWINPSAINKTRERLRYYTFTGRLFGKAVLEGLVFETNMALPFLKHFLGVPITFSDLEYLDEKLYTGCVWIRDNPNVESLCLTFSIQTPEGYIHPLKPNGEDIDVNDENKMEYLELLLQYHMLGSVSEPLGAMLTGFYEIIPKHVIAVFDYQELDFFLSGLPEINVKDWQANSRVQNFASEHDMLGLIQEIKVIEWFWDTVYHFRDEERARLLQFATGSTRVPVEGFKALTSASGYIHPFTIQLVERGPPPVGLCPRAHTCFNRIDLPVYHSKKELANYLTLVIQMEITGFGFE